VSCEAGWVTNRILTTHVGSLIRPPELVPYLAALENGHGIDSDGFGSALTTAVGDVVRRQVDIGLDIIDDGEFSKTSWITYFYGRVGGIEERSVALRDTNTLPPNLDREAFAEYYDGHDIAQAPDVSAGHTGAGEHAVGTASTGHGRQWVCTGPLTYDATEIDRDIDNLKRAAADAGAEQMFLPVLAPASAYWLDNEYYASGDEFVFALADALHEEYRRIVDAGVLLQIDDAVLWHMYGTMRLKGQSADDYRRWAIPRVEALNHALAGIAPEHVRYHVCCGSWHGAHAFDPGLAEILDLVLQVNARAYLIEQANARHEHEWQIWETLELPEEKVLVPGVITHHTEMVEHPQLVAQRLVRLAELVGRERVMAGADCGFAQGALTRRVPEWTQWAKLTALVEGAQMATAQLWGERRR
jgi:5-methyltetrahydropteroyltriglutamate--homocysteine methyltransferase